MEDGRLREPMLTWRDRAPARVMEGQQRGSKERQRPGRWEGRNAHICTQVHSHLLILCHPRFVNFFLSVSLLPRGEMGIETLSRDNF
jgi:hypothetical protein